MNRKVSMSFACALALSTMLGANEDLGVIKVESSTIDDKFDAKKMEVSNTVTLKGSQIEEAHAENIANVLNKVPGLTVRQNEGDSNKIHIRGVATEMYMGEKPGVAIVIDGVPVQERSGSVNIDSDNIESIKIIKGGASYLYGNDALAGAVVITTKRPKGKNEGFASIERGSHGYGKYLANYLGSTEEYAVQIQGSYKTSDGYWENSDYWAKSFNGKIQYYLDDSSDITFGADKSTRFENDTGSLTHTVGGVNQIDTNPTSIGEVGYSVKSDIDLDKYFLTYSKDLDDKSNLMAQVYRYEDTTVKRSGAYDGISGNGLLRDDHLYNSYSNTIQDGLKTEYRKDDEKLAYMVGLDLARNEESKNSKDRVNDVVRGTVYSIGNLRSDTKFNEDINALYGEAKYQIDEKIVASFNARIDQMDYDYTNNMTSKTWNKDFNEESYKLGATYKLKKDSILFANISTGFRVPTIDQLYAGDMSTSTRSGTYSNNTDIKTETTLNFEIGHRIKLGTMTYDASIYQLNRDDVIGRSSGNYSGTRGVNIQYENMADVRNRGLEISANSDKKKQFSYGVNYTYLNSEYTKYDEYNLILNNTTTGSDYVEGVYNLAGNTVPRTSKHTINLEGNYKAMSNLMLTAELNYRSSQFADDLNRIKVAGYSVVNLKTKYNTKVSGYPVEFFVKVDNVLDKQYYMMPRVTGDRNDDGVYSEGDMGLTVNPGRVYLAGLNMKF